MERLMLEIMVSRLTNSELYMLKQIVNHELNLSEVAINEGLEVRI